MSNSRILRFLGFFSVIGISFVAIAGGGPPPPPPTGSCPLTSIQPSGIISVAQSSVTVSSGANDCIVNSQNSVTTVRASINTTSYQAVGNFVVLYLNVVGGLSPYAYNSSGQGILDPIDCDNYQSLCENATADPTDPTDRLYLQFSSSVFCNNHAIYQPNSTQVISASCHFMRDFIRRFGSTNDAPNIVFYGTKIDNRGEPPVGTIHFTDGVYSGQSLAAFSVNTFFVQ
jgi:hypothetical protein